MTPRCIAMSADARRCSHKAGKPMGDLFICRRHSMWTQLFIDDMLAPQTRRMLAYAEWETAREGQALIAHMHRKGAAA